MGSPGSLTCTQSGFPGPEGIPAGLIGRGQRSTISHVAAPPKVHTGPHDHPFGAGPPLDSALSARMNAILVGRVFKTFSSLCQGTGDGFPQAVPPSPIQVGTPSWPVAHSDSPVSSDVRFHHSLGDQCGHSVFSVRQFFRMVRQTLRLGQIPVNMALLDQP